MPIGGGDMPTVIALLNSYAGAACAAMGFALENRLLIIAGALNASSGFILSVIMCKAMNRSFANVLFGAFGAAQTSAAAQASTKPVHSASPEDAAAILESARRVIVVPGYGMAVAQAQHKLRELTDILNKRGVQVDFAIHPVAGRMPGHMNVLLAEADIPYDKLHEMEDINPDFAEADVALVIGANDVVNPAARHDKTSPIYGMPILDVDKAHTVMVIKRSMNPGFAGIDNELYYHGQDADAVRRRQRIPRRDREGAGREQVAVPIRAASSLPQRKAWPPDKLRSNAEPSAPAPAAAWRCRRLDPPSPCCRSRSSATRRPPRDSPGTRR